MDRESKPLAVEQVWNALDRPLWVVTAQTGSDRGGLIATWVIQASLDSARPTVMIGIGPNHHTRKVIDASQAFALHLLAKRQLPLVELFAANSGWRTDKFSQIPYSTKATGSPILDEHYAWLDCRVYAALDVGDRIFYWADVMDCGGPVSGGPGAADRPLSEWDLRGLRSEVLARLRADKEADIEAQAPLALQWRAGMPDWIRRG